MIQSLLDSIKSSTDVEINLEKTNNKEFTLKLFQDNGKYSEDEIYLIFNNYNIKDLNNLITALTMLKKQIQ